MPLETTLASHGRGGGYGSWDGGCGFEIVDPSVYGGGALVAWREHSKDGLTGDSGSWEFDKMFSEDGAAPRDDEVCV